MGHIESLSNEELMDTKKLKRNVFINKIYKNPQHYTGKL